MAETKILIVEDDPIIARHLAQVLRDAGYVVTACVDNGEDAQRSALEDTPDLAFVDIHILGKDDGIVTAAKLKQINDILIIFLTNLNDRETVNRAIEVKPASYLLKPFNPMEVYANISIALRNAAERREAKLKEPADVNEQDSFRVLKDKFFIRQNSGAFMKYDISEIVYLEADRAYSNIHLLGKPPIMQTSSMKVLESKLNHPNLQRVNRSYIVNIQHIEGIKGNVLIVNGEEITISPEYVDVLRQHLNIVR